MSDTITIPCAHCGNAVTLERPNTGMVLMDKLLMRLTEGVVHDQCYRDVSAARQLKEAAERLQQRGLHARNDRDCAGRNEAAGCGAQG